MFTVTREDVDLVRDADRGQNDREYGDGQIHGNAHPTHHAEDKHQAGADLHQRERSGCQASKEYQEDAHHEHQRDGNQTDMPGHEHSPLKKRGWHPQRGLRTWGIRTQDPTGNTQVLKNVGPQKRLSDGRTDHVYRIGVMGVGVHYLQDGLIEFCSIRAFWNANEDDRGLSIVRNQCSGIEFDGFEIAAKLIQLAVRTWKWF